MDGISAGLRFGHLVTVSTSYHHSRRWWLCACDCGEQKEAREQHLRSGAMKSCGCSRTPIKHGMHGTSEYSIWQAMKNRCRLPSNIGYANYGGRGISVCDRWQSSFEAFFADVGPRPSSKHSLDREDNSKGYEPGNVRWTTKDVQTRNTRRNRYITAFGRAQTVTDWAVETGLSFKCITDRIDRLGWSAEDAVSRPADRHASRAYGREG